MTSKQEREPTMLEWHGPYKVVRWIEKVNYLIDMRDRGQLKKIFNVNMMRKWYTPKVHANLLARKSQTPTLEYSEPRIRPNLTKGEHEQLLREFEDVFSDKPRALNSHQLSATSFSADYLKPMKRM